MPDQSIANQRLRNQCISSTPFSQPEQVVRWLGAVQAQDYYAGKWALGLRTNGARDEDVERAISQGTLLRTHLLRPTWHLVTAEDIRWILALTAPRVNAFNAYYYRRLELDDTVFAQSNDTLAKALEGGNQLTRDELVAVLKQAGITSEDALRFGLLIMRAELDGVICSGARRGKQITYALLDERAPKQAVLEKEAALAELTRRYFTSRGPATLRDYIWWSGLSAAEAKAGLEMVRSQLVQEEIDGKTYWLPASTAAASPPAAPGPTPTAYLLPNYDEYTVGYTDRSAVFDARHQGKLNDRDSLLTHVVVIDGLIAGTWKTTRRKSDVSVSIRPFAQLNAAERGALSEALRCYSAFLGLPVVEESDP